MSYPARAEGSVNRTMQKKQLYGQLPPISKIIQVRRTRQPRLCKRSKDVRISDVHTWTHQCYSTSKDVHKLSLSGHWMLPRGSAKAMNGRDWWRKSGISVLSARYDDNDDVCINLIPSSTGRLWHKVNFQAEPKVVYLPFCWKPYNVKAL